MTESEFRQDKRLGALVIGGLILWGFATRKREEIPTGKPGEVPVTPPPPPPVVPLPPEEPKTTLISTPLTTNLETVISSNGQTGIVESYLAPIAKERALANPDYQKWVRNVSPGEFVAKKKGKYVVIPEATYEGAIIS